MNYAHVFATKSFNSFGNYAKHAKRWKLDFRKLDKGPFSGILSILDVETVQVIRTQLSGVMDQFGKFQKGYRTFIVPANDQFMAIWEDTVIKENSIIVFPKHGNFKAVSYDNFDVFAISIIEHHLLDISNESMPPEKNSLNTKNGCVYKISKEELDIVRSMLLNIFSEIKINPTIIHSSNFTFHVKYQLPHSILCALNKHLVKEKPMKRKRDIALRKATEYIQNNINCNISVNTLSQMVGTSERTLEYAFKERYGIAPKTYITYSKLNKIKEILSNPDNQEMVSAVAQKFGFNHMGQFSADYKNLLGELPRKTVLKKKGKRLEQE